MLLTSAVAFAQSPPKPNESVAPKAEQEQSSACAHADTQATIGQGGDVKVPTRRENRSAKSWRGQRA